MGGYLTYTGYKDSEVEWLGETPEHWDVRRFKFLVSEPFKYGANEAAELDDPDLPRYIRITDVRDDGTLREETFRSLPEEIAKDYLLETGDILLARSGATVGKTFIYDTSWGKAAYAGYLIRARLSNEADERFIYQFLQSSSYWEWVKSIFIQATIQNISAEKYANLWLPIPPLSEQQKIAAFLDYKTAQIEALIAKKEALLEKLAEKRTALISQAVTKGLDATVPMKDSGIEWLGEIPEHWKTSRLKFISRIIDCKNRTPEYFDDGEYLVVRTTNVRAGNLLLADAYYTDKKNYTIWTKRGIPPAGSILFTREAPAGEVCLVPHELALCMGQRMMNFIPNNELMNKFMLYFLRSQCFLDFIAAQSSGSTVTHLRVEQVYNIDIVIPPANEIIAIAEYIEFEEQKIQNSMVKVSLAIQKLKEYRTALITNAVTGKIDVRDIRLPEPTQLEAA